LYGFVIKKSRITGFQGWSIKKFLFRAAGLVTGSIYHDQEQPDRQHDNQPADGRRRIHGLDQKIFNDPNMKTALNL
jgi:hypothetical protein